MLVFGLFDAGGVAKIRLMRQAPDIGKVVHQHTETEEFFGGFSVKGGGVQEDEMAVAEKTKALESIADEVRQCRKCELGSQRTNAVPGEGSPNARIMFIGEAPGADEDAQGRPFVGRAGQLLDKVINACGLKRSDVFIGNILKMPPTGESRPPGGRDNKLFALSAKTNRGNRP